MSIYSSVHLHVLYEYTCDCCQQSYIGSTSLQLYRRCTQHKGVSFRTNTVLTRLDNSPIRVHYYQLDHRFKLENVKIIDSAFYKKALRILEALYIKTHKPPINSNQNSNRLNILE